MTNTVTAAKETTFTEGIIELSLAKNSYLIRPTSLFMHYCFQCKTQLCYNMNISQWLTDNVAIFSTIIISFYSHLPYCIMTQIHIWCNWLDSKLYIYSLDIPSVLPALSPFPLLLLSVCTANSLLLSLSILCLFARSHPTIPPPVFS